VTNQIYISETQVGIAQIVKIDGICYERTPTVIVDDGRDRNDKPIENSYQECIDCLATLRPEDCCRRSFMPPTNSSAWTLQRSVSINDLTLACNSCSENIIYYIEYEGDTYYFCEKNDPKWKLNWFSPEQCIWRTFSLAKQGETVEYFLKQVESKSICGVGNIESPNLIINSVLCE